MTYQPYIIAKEQYPVSSAYSEPSLQYGEARPLNEWSRDKQWPAMERDASTLAEMLQPVYLSDYSSIADQVFGTQTRQQRLSLQHIVNLIAERAQLHKRHLDDINHRHMKFQERLFGARLHGKLDGYGRATRLEQTLSQLEDQKRQEELGFWKDTAELRDKLFEGAGEYQAIRHRVSLLEDMEPGGEVYG